MDNRDLPIENEPNRAGISLMLMGSLQAVVQLVKDFLYYSVWLYPYIDDFKNLVSRIMSYLNTKLDHRTKNKLPNTLNFLRFLYTSEDESEWLILKSNNNHSIENTIHELDETQNLIKDGNLAVEITDDEAIKDIMSNIQKLRIEFNNKIESSLPTFNLRGRMNEIVVENSKEQIKEESKEECEKCEKCEKCFSLLDWIIWLLKLLYSFILWLFKYLWIFFCIYVALVFYFLTVNSYTDEY